MAVNRTRGHSYFKIHEKFYKSTYNSKTYSYEPFASLQQILENAPLPYITAQWV
jgi:hypothetical protein